VVVPSMYRNLIRVDHFYVSAFPKNGSVLC
jgi:hypothetical protein